MTDSSPESPALLTLGCDEIDRDHRAFLELIAALRRAGDVDFPTMFRRLQEHTEQHFAREEQLMQTCAFPALREHKSEHVRVLGELHQFGQRAARGLLPFARAFVAERLVPWFELHIQTMDAALVVHMQRASGSSAEAMRRT